MLCMSTPFILVAQDCNYSLSGTVIDYHTKKPLVAADVTIIDSGITIKSDKSGNYLFSGLCGGTIELEVSHPECNTVIHTLTLKANTQKDLFLEHHLEELQGVTITGQQQKEKGTETISQVTLNKAEIKGNPTQSLAAAISGQQGVTFASSGTNVQLPVIHGLFGNRILILNNGLKHGFQNWGDEHAPEIDITAANNITIIKGAAGVRFGPEALGGAILVDANPLRLEAPSYATIETGFQTNGLGVNTNFELGKGFKNWSYFLNGNYTRIGDREAPDYNLTNTGKEEKSIGFGTRYTYKNWDFKVHYSFLDQNLALLRSSIVESGDAFIRAINSDEPIFIESFSYDINEPNQEVQHHLAKVEVNWWYSNEGKLTFRGGTQLNRRDEFDVRRNSELPIIDLDLVTNDYQLEWKHPNWQGLDGLIGIQYFSQDNDNNPGTQTTPFIPNYNSDRFSAFITESMRFNKNTLEAGVRLDHESNDVRGRETNQDIFRDEFSFTNFTATIGFTRAFSENTTFRTNLGTAWRTPNMAELFSFGQNSFKTTFGLLRFTDSDGTPSTDDVIPFDDSSVEPERGYKFINELQTSKNGNFHNLTLYSHYIEDYIFDRPIGVFGTIRGPMPAFIFDQADALFLGVDYSWKKEWTEQVSGIFGLSYLWSRNIGENEPLINQPPISTSFEFQWNHGKFWKFDTSKLMIRPSYTFRQFQAPRTISPESLVNGSSVISSDSEIFDFLDAPDGYFLIDLAWNFSFKNFGASISVHNLLNNSYRNYLNELRYFADEPGRNILFTLNYSFKTKNND